ncbi:unnamed protein product [Adineta ricciae]|uniref:C2 domain-containing protein n=1 Tax=Adineta ricciae TaxID=249248 RepID=A0A813VKD4_ADIRI|nr:unnamed protein product [Adineta ricciae]
MHTFNMYSLSLIAIFMIDQIMSNPMTMSNCVLWADPHLVKFAVHPSLSDRRPSFYCQSAGPMLVLKNRYIEITVNVTDRPFWNENFEIKLFAGPDTLCTVSPQNFQCPDKNFLRVKRLHSTMVIKYDEADDLSVTIYSNTINGRNTYDIHVSQSFNLIRQSYGLCVNEDPACELEHAPNPAGKRKRSLDDENAMKVCDVYMQEAYTTAKKELGNVSSPLNEYARTACINDVSLTGNREWGRSSVSFVAMEALRLSGLVGKERERKLESVVYAVKNAISRGDESSCLPGVSCTPRNPAGTFS